MYNNVGAKIKSIAEAIAYGGVAVCVIVGIICIYIGTLFQTATFSIPIIIVGAVLAVLGSILVWWSHILLAGFGELVKETTKSAAELKEIKELLAGKQVNLNEDEASKEEISTK